MLPVVLEEAVEEAAAREREWGSSERGCD